VGWAVWLLLSPKTWAGVVWVGDGPGGEGRGEELGLGVPWVPSELRDPVQGQEKPGLGSWWLMRARRSPDGPSVVVRLRSWHRWWSTISIPALTPSSSSPLPPATLRLLRLHHLHGAASPLLRLHLLQGAGDEGPDLRRDRLGVPSGGSQPERQNPGRVPQPGRRLAGLSARGRAPHASAFAPHRALYRDRAGGSGGCPHPSSGLPAASPGTD